MPDGNNLLLEYIDYNTVVCRTSTIVNRHVQAANFSIKHLNPSLSPSPWIFAV